ncbi:MAG: 16S rRNA (guanine(527)-N(7))-methyltransferase RsmG [Clostridiales Family XIII bacterium]|jgi:16S rRNA (guanine527-N7)-methyltransferase|nr:16S rRNA (guanine(527)-N(7))-methyltransferase RsmG [Clostridiales Family XIII bacterium]
MRALREALAARGIDCPEAAIETFRAYRELVLLRNERVNLTAITDGEEFVAKHFADSVLCADWPETRAARRIIDVGTGAGFPGIPLAILLPEQQFTLIDSLGKRVRVLEEIVSRLGLQNVRPICGRAEDLARDASLRGAFDLCVSRAVARLPVLAEYCLPFLRVGGFLFAYKGEDVADELASARVAFSVLGGRPRDVRDASLEACGLRHKIAVVEKIAETPPKYPRRAGAPARRPL